MKNTKKILAIVLAVVLLVGAAVGATIAWFTDMTEVVTNTFTSAKLFANPDDDFTLWEHEAVDEDANGLFELNDTEVKSNTYVALPGVNIPKDPTVDVVDLLENAYLYIKVEGTLPTGMTYAIDDELWEVLDEDVYPGIWVYCGPNADANKVIQAHGTSKTFTATILEDNQIVVADTYAGDANNNTLAFYAYMVQATGNGANAAEAWANTYGAPTP